MHHRTPISMMEERTKHNKHDWFIRSRGIVRISRPKASLDLPWIFRSITPTARNRTWQAPGGLVRSHMKRSATSRCIWYLSRIIYIRGSLTNQSGSDSSHLTWQCMVLSCLEPEDTLMTLLSLSVGADAIPVLYYLHIRIHLPEIRTGRSHAVTWWTSWLCWFVNDWTESCQALSDRVG